MEKETPATLHDAARVGDVARLEELLEAGKPAFLGAVLLKTEDKDVHFKYIEAAAKVGNLQEVERVTREDTFYDPEKVRDFLKEVRLPDQRLEFVDRVKYMIKSGGENIYPREVEEFLYSHPDIQDVQIIGVPDDKFGEEVLASIIMKPDRPPLTMDALKAFCKDRLAHYKVPRYLEIVSEYPMTVTGKVRKVEMRAQAVEKLNLQKAAAAPTT